MKNLKKKGFTIVELVIVIAVVAILAAVLIPTFVNLTKKANVSNDTVLVKNLNTALTSDTVEHNTMYDALKAAEDFGYDIAKINTKAEGNKILWDSVNDCFVYLDSEKDQLVYIPDSKKTEPKDHELWIISNEVNEKYSTYLYEYVENTVNAKLGLDTGDCQIETINYISDSSNKIVIRTNSATTTLNINAANGTVDHYGSLGTLNVAAIAEDCFYEFGKTAYAKVDSGKIVANKGGQINVLYVTNSSVKVLSNNGNVLAAYCTDNNYKPTEANVTFDILAEDEIINLGNNAKQEAINDELVANNKNNVASVGQVAYTSLQDAVTAATNGAEVVVLKDIELTSVLNISSEKNIILNVNGKTITPADNLSDLIENHGTLTITGEGTLNSGYYDIVYNLGTLVIEGNCTFYGESIKDNAISLIYNKGSLTINSGTFDKTGLPANATIDNDGSINKATCTINGGEFTGCTIVNGNWGDIEIIINGGKFNSNADISNVGNQYMFSAGEGTMYINGGEFIFSGNTGNYKYGAYVPSDKVIDKAGIVVK